MKLREVFQFELSYQLRRFWTWLFLVFFVGFAFVLTTENFLPEARDGGFFANSPFVIAAVVVLSCALWLVVAAAVAGEAAARDVQTRMHPLTYTIPVRKAEYLGGRFLAAFALNALILLAPMAGILMAVYSPAAEPELVGPFRPSAYVAAYGLVALPTVFFGTAIQFSAAALSRRAIASHLCGVLLLAAAFVVPAVVVGPGGAREVGMLLDPVGIALVSDLAARWSSAEMSTRLVGLDGWFLGNRLLWVAVAVATLALTHRRFRFAHPEAGARRRRGAPAGRADLAAPAKPGAVRELSVAVPRVRGSFGLVARARQTLAIASASFGSVLKSRSGLLFLGVIAVLAFISASDALQHLGVPLVPRTDLILHGLTVPEIGPLPWIIIPLLIVFWSGELVWREREAGMSEIADAAPVPDSVLFAGKLLGLALVLATCVAIRMAAGILVQVGMGYHRFEIGVYVRVLFGLELAGYLLLALLAMVVHVLVNQKYVGHLVTLVAYGLIAAASLNGLGHRLLVYSSDPGWTYTEMRGFGTALAPWLWFHLYWAAWALLLGVLARLLWVRGRETGMGARIRMARRRLTRAGAGTAAVAVGSIVVLGGFIFYNTSVLNEYERASDRAERRAEYERRYGRFEGFPQPRPARTTLRVEIHPDRSAAEIRGTYHLVNRAPLPIDSVHLATAPAVRTGPVSFDRPARPVLIDDEHGHRIYALETPLQPGDSLRLDFEVRVEPRGFRGDATLPTEPSVAADGTHFTNQDWLPAIGYQWDRELARPAERAAHGLQPRAPVRPLAEVAAHPDSAGKDRIDFEAVVGTSPDQVAVAPGVLRRTWTEEGRRYFHYATDAPIGNEYALFSARYGVHEDAWNGVTIQIFHHSVRAASRERMLRSARAALDYYTEQFGPYPYRYIRLVETPGHGVGMHAEAATISFQEGFALLDPDDGPRGYDLPSLVVAHEVAHQWWGSYLAQPRVEGALLLSEALAQYSAFRVVERTHGPEHLRAVLARMRASEGSRARAEVPLLRTTSTNAAYRRAPLALYALGEYAGEEQVNQALRRLLEAHRAGGRPATSLDLYRELQAAVPDSLRALVHDLLASNTYWELALQEATAQPTSVGNWRVTLRVRARKMVIDSAGTDTPVAMDDLVEIGIYAPAAQQGAAGETLHLGMHRIRSGEQTITVTVPQKPARAAVDPRQLLGEGSPDSQPVRLAPEG